MSLVLQAFQTLWVGPLKIVNGNPSFSLGFLGGESFLEAKVF
jgi:hypothetical protein